MVVVRSCISNQGSASCWGPGIYIRTQGQHPRWGGGGGGGGGRKVGEGRGEEGRFGGGGEFRSCISNQESASCWGLEVYISNQNHNPCGDLESSLLTQHQ